MKNVLLRIWSIFFYILFAGFFTLIFPLHWLLLKFKANWAHDLSHRLNMLWGFVITFPVGVWIRSYGREKIDRKRTYIFAPNHSSYLDIPICNVSIRNSFRFIGKAELNRLPLFGYMFKRLHIPVNRGSVTESYKSFLHAKEVLKKDRSVLLFPEGTIPDKTQVTLLKFKDGAFRMAIEAKVPIVPVTIVGADRALADNGKWLLRPSIVKVIFHDPIETANMEVAEAARLKDEIFEIIHTQLTGAPSTAKSEALN